MKKVLEFPGCILAHTVSGTTHLLSGSRELTDLMDGDCFDDACMDEGMKTLPTDPGVYSATIEYWFSQGYFEGYPAPGESDYDFMLSNLQRIDLSRTPAPAEVERLVRSLVYCLDGHIGNYQRQRREDPVPQGVITAREVAGEISRLLAALSNTTPYLSGDVKGVYKYDIDSPGESAAGIRGFTDEVTITVDSGDPGGEETGEDSFAEHMRQALTDWYDGAKVTNRKAGE